MEPSAVIRVQARDDVRGDCVRVGHSDGRGGSAGGYGSTIEM